ncbi:14382_t:CDS:2, partial [Acaulospora morrowiae]
MASKSEIISETVHASEIFACPKCKIKRDVGSFCKECTPNELVANFDKWSSGDEKIDELIRESQKNATRYDNYLKWFPYECLEEFKEIARGGFGIIYHAKCEVQWRGCKPQLSDVALKKIKKAPEVSSDFFQEVRTFYQCCQKRSHDIGIIRIIGISKDPEDGQYMLMMDYAAHGSLRSFLKKFYSKLNWKTVIKFVKSICEELHSQSNVKVANKNTVGEQSLAADPDKIKSVITCLITT